MSGNLPYFVYIILILFYKSTAASEYGETCDLENPCNEGMFLTCSNGKTCDCNSSISMLDVERNSCVGLVNSICQNSNDCVPNAKCPSDTTGGVRRCSCLESFTPTSNGTCLVDHFQSCSNHWTTACNPDQGLICNQGNCTCKYQEFQIYDKVLGQCRSKVLGPCEGGTIPCVENSHCSTSSTEEGGYSDECECDTGFSEVDGYCQLSIGQPCNCTFNRQRSQSSYNHWNRRDDIPAGPVCDTLVPLKCIDGFCKCPPLKYYDRQYKSCRGLVGATCDMYGSSSSTACGQGAVCSRKGRSRDSHSSKGICACKSEWTVSKDRRCIL